MKKASKAYPLKEERTKPSACGFLYCYNEEKVLRDVITYYLSEGVDLVVFDNCSFDSSPEIVKEFQEQSNDKTYPLYRRFLDSLKRSQQD